MQLKLAIFNKSMRLSVRWRQMRAHIYTRTHTSTHAFDPHYMSKYNKSIDATNNRDGQTPLTTFRHHQSLYLNLVTTGYSHRIGAVQVSGD